MPFYRPILLAGLVATAVAYGACVGQPSTITPPTTSPKPFQVLSTLELILDPDEGLRLKRGGEISPKNSVTYQKNFLYRLQPLPVDEQCVRDEVNKLGENIGIIPQLEDGYLLGFEVPTIDEAEKYFEDLLGIEVSCRSDDLTPKPPL